MVGIPAVMKDAFMTACSGEQTWTGAPCGTANGAGRNGGEVQRASVAGSASAVLGALMFAGGIAVTLLMALRGEGAALPMVAVVAGGAVAVLLATALLTRQRDPSTLHGDTRA